LLGIVARTDPPPAFDALPPVLRDFQPAELARGGPSGFRGGVGGRTAVALAAALAQHPIRVGALKRAMWA
jgi:hypothetical protein